MILTHHWSASGPSRIREYHVEYALKSRVSSALRQQLIAAKSPAGINWIELRAMFDIWKNVDFAVATDYGTWHMNHDPRDNSANVEVGALCMGGESVTLPGPWGQYPFTVAHAWMAVGIGARIAALKNLDANASFKADGFQNQPLYVISTHGERAIQTPDSDAVLRPSYGYFAYSGDGDCRWDLSARDASEASVLATPAGAYASAIKTAAWIRSMTHEAKAAGIHDFWGLDGPVAP